jgi:lipoprotein-releasing system permease protein
MAAAADVRRSTPVTYLAALAEDPADAVRPLPVVLKAVDEPPEYTSLEAWPEGIVPPVVIGDGLARALGATIGSTVVVRFPPTPGSWITPVVTFEVVGTFSLAFTEFDNRWIVAPLGAVTGALPGTDVAGVELVLTDPLAVEDARRRVEPIAPDLVFTDWREMNRPLFAALRWQTLSLFVVLALVVVVASFQLSSALVVLTIDKRRTAGMLQALGATPTRVWRILALAGVMLGGAGVAAGLAIGGAACAVLTATRAVRFPQHLARIYLVDHVPFVISVGDAAIVAAVCLLLVCTAAAWPAWTSARREPAALLRAV